MLLLVFWSRVEVGVDPEKSLFCDTKYCSLTFFTKREKTDFNGNSETLMHVQNVQEDLALQNS